MGQKTKLGGYFTWIGSGLGEYLSYSWRVG